MARLALENGRHLDCNLDFAGLRDLVLLQLTSNFGRPSPAEAEAIEGHLARALVLAESCFRRVAIGYCHGPQGVRLNAYHSGQYCLLLHFLTRAAHEAQGPSSLCERLYYLNRILHAVDLFYAAGLPDLFYLDHPLGSCMGRAQYADGLIFFQGCTVGGRKDEHPVLGQNVALFAGASIIGRCRVGANTALSAGARVVNQDVPGDCLVFGTSPELVFKPLPEGFFETYFRPGAA